MSEQSQRGLSRRQFLHLTLTGAAGALLAAACQPVTTGVQAPAAAPASEQPIEIAWWFWVGSEKDKEWLQPLVTGFSERYPQYRVRMETPAYDGYKEKIMSMIAAGTPPEHFQLTGGDWYRELIKQNVLMDLTETATELNVDKEELPVQQVACKVDGKYWGLTTICHTFGLYYNEDMFTAAGVKTPVDYWNEKNWTWDTFLEVAKALSTGPEDARETFGYLINEWADFGGWMWSAGGQEVDNIAPVTKVTFDSDPALQGLRFLQDLRCKYKAAPTPQQLQSGVDLFGTGKVAMQWMGTWVRMPWASELKFKWNVAPFPLHPQLKKPFQYGHYGIRANSAGLSPEVAAAAIAWVKYDHSLDAQKLEAASFSVLPINKTIATSDATLKAGEPYGKGDLNNWVFIDGVDNVRVDAVDPNYSQIKNEVINPELDLFWSCKLSADDLVAKVVPAANQKLTK